MPTWLSSKAWGRAKIRLPRNVIIAKQKKGSKVARAGKAALAGLDGNSVIKAALAKGKSK